MLGDPLHWIANRQGVYEADLGNEGNYVLYGYSYSQTKTATLWWLPTGTTLYTFDRQPSFFKLTTGTVTHCMLVAEIDAVARVTYSG